MAEVSPESKIIHIEQYLEDNTYLSDISTTQEILSTGDKLKILEKTFLIIGKSCHINSDSVFPYQNIINDKKENIFNISDRMPSDSYYEESGSVNGWGVNFTIEEKGIKGSVFIGFINGILKYSTFGLQKYKETKTKSHYYHVSDGLILSAITCTKADTFLEELTHVENIEPFAPTITKKYKIKKRSANN